MSDITPMATVPSEVNYGRITAHFVAFLADLEGWEPGAYGWTKN